MMDTRKIAAIYNGGVQAYREMLDILESVQLIQDVELRDNYLCVDYSAENMIKSAHKIFVKEFPESFAECINSDVFDIEAFYKLIDENHEIIACCEDKFFDFVKQHVETNVGGLKHTLMFNWNWTSIYGALSCEQIKEYVKETKSPAFEKMVLAIARHIDLIQAQKQQMAILFFNNAAEFDYPNFRERIIENLQKNQSFEAWINEAIETLKKGEV